VQSAPEVVAARRKLGNEGDDLEDEDAAIVVDDEQTALMAGEAAAQNSVEEDTANALSHYHRTVSLTTSRISSIGVGMGYASGVGVLCLTVIPVTVMRGSLFSLRLAIGLSGIWWAVFTLPAARLLPAITEDEARQGVIGQGASRRKDHLVRDKIAQGWTRLGTMLHWKEIGRLRVTFWYLLAWALLSDGELGFFAGLFS
jgi:UMF1 family MFS transporter